MPKPLEVRPLPNCRLWLRYDDGAQGEVDLSDLAGRGVFKAWNDSEFFQSVKIGPQGELAWSDDVELCSDSVYVRLTGKSADEVFPGLNRPKGMPEISSREDRVKAAKALAALQLPVDDVRTMERESTEGKSGFRA